MNSDSTIVAARAFARNLNILLKTVRLYGLEHDRTAALFEAAWSELRAAIESAGKAGLLLGVSGTQVLVDGAPLEARPTDRSFAQLLTSAGLSSIHFSPRATSDDLARFVRAFASRAPKSGALAAQLKAALDGKGEPAIRINEIRFVAQDAALADAGLAAQVAARSLGAGEAGAFEAWLKDPHKLLQLIAAAEGARGAGAAVVGGAAAAPASATVASSAPATPVAEEDVVSVIRLLSQLGESGNCAESGAGEFHEHLKQLPSAARMSLTQALSQLAAARPGARPDTPLLLQLAEHVAIRFALERYERGDARINAVVELLDRMKREIGSLRNVLKVHEETLGRAGLDVESHADILERQFWAGLPAGAKRKILLSPEAWVIPPRNVRQYGEELLEGGDAETARAILSNYAACLHTPAAEACRKVALGLTDLADLFARAGGDLLGSVIGHLGERLKAEMDGDLQSLLGAAFVRFSHEAAARRQYSAVQQALDSLEIVEERQPFLAELLAPRIRVVNRLREFIEDAMGVERPPQGLVEVLRRMPRLAVEQISSRLSRCTRREECDRLVALAAELGTDGIEQLRETLANRPAPEATFAVALLSRLEPGVIEQLLPGRLREWDRIFHDQTVRQLALGGAAARGGLLARLLRALDVVAWPGALDEIGMSGDQAAGPRLVEWIQGWLGRTDDAFLALKGIEALGRLREPKAAGLLRPLVEEKRLWLWRQPRELRITAAQALKKIDPDWAKSFLPTSGLSEAELGLAALDPVPAAPWVRQRRYERIRLPRALTGFLTTLHGATRLNVEALSLGGGVGKCQRHLRPGSVLSVELRPGFGRVEAEVLVREARPQQLTFELVRIGLEDRAKLRRPLVGLRSS